MVPSNAMSWYCRSGVGVTPSCRTTAAGTRETSAPESSSIGTSAPSAPVAGSRRVTMATGAGGWKRAASYAGIRLDHLHGELGGLLGVQQTGADHPRPRNCRQVGNED